MLLHFFVRLNFVLTDKVNISEELEFFFACFFIFFISLPSRGRPLFRPVSDLSFLIAVLITPVFCGIFQHSEIIFLNLCIVNKMCPNQISLSLFKIYIWKTYANMYMCICLQSIKEVWRFNWFRKHEFCTVDGVIVFCDFLSL